MQSTHILGMAKSCLDLKGAKSAKVELDFLRLVYSVQKLREKGDFAFGYFAVVPNITPTIEKWVAKYQIDIYKEFVFAIPVNLNETQTRELVAEKVNNSFANTKHHNKDVDKKLSSGFLGETYFEEVLKSEILKKHKELNDIGLTKYKESEMPFKIRWDFYGKIE